MAGFKKFILIIISFLILIFFVAAVYILFLNNRQSNQSNIVLQNCDPNTNICKVSSGVCNPSKAYLHICSDVKSNNEKCVSESATQITNTSFTEGTEINLNNYIKGITCGSAQLYLELENSGVNSVGACGSTIKRFENNCGIVSYTQNTNTPKNKFILGTSYSSTCQSNGNALLNYTVSVSNTSVNTSLIDSLTVELPKNTTAKNISNNGKFNESKITWDFLESEKSFKQLENKNFTFSIEIQKSNLTQNSVVNTTSVLNYTTEDGGKNITTFELNAKPNCTIQTTNSLPANTNNNNTNLPSTALSDDLKYLLTGIWFMILAGVVYKYKLGSNFVKKLIEKF